MPFRIVNNFHQINTDSPVTVLLLKIKNLTKIIQKNIKYYILSKRKIITSRSAFEIMELWDSKYKRNLANIRNIGVRVLKEPAIRSYKTSNTLFVLASGPSINEITNIQWKHVAKHDSIGFNTFWVHPFVPTYYHIEVESAYLDFFERCYKNQSDDFRRIPLIVNFLHLQYSGIDPREIKFGNNQYFSIPRRYSGTNEEQLAEILSYKYLRCDYRKENLIVHHCSSLSVMISFGILMGYKKIVLLGSDLYSRDYFFFDKTLYNKPIDEELRQRKQKSSPSLEQREHEILNPAFTQDYGELPIDRFIMIFKDTVLAKLGVELLIGSKRSKLYPMLNYYEDLDNI